MKKVVCDIETDDLNPNFIWLIVATDVETKERKIFKRPDLFPEEFLEWAPSVDVWIGHNFLLFDYKTVLLKFFPQLNIQREKILDTLICSRLFRYDAEDGHSVEAWAKRFGMQKPKIDDFTQGLTEEMIVRCTEDVAIQMRMYEYMKKHIESDVFKKAIEVEHDASWICGEIKDNGFGFDVEGAKELRARIAKRVEELDKIIQEAYPPQEVEEIFIPMVNNKTRGYVKGEPFIKRTVVPFNPGSPKQIVEKLNEAGWQPTEKTKGHIKAERNLRMSRDKQERALLKEKLEEYKVSGWACSEENLATLPDTAPEAARRLAEWLTLSSRVRTLNEWIECYTPETKAIHPTLMPIGAWTHRMSHQAPNSANIPGHYAPKDKNHITPVEQIKLDYNLPMRSLWRARTSRRLVGVDADGIQLRILAHATNDMDAVEALVNGDKKNKTDAHSLNARRLGIGDERRDDAKTFIYAWVLGAAVPKVAEILKCDIKQAKRAVESFLEANPALKEFKEHQIPLFARKGYFTGIDGRAVVIDGEHKCLAGILQCGEATVMKRANAIWRGRLLKEKIPFWQVNFVHDEWVTEVPDDDEIANHVMKAQMDAIAEAGVEFNLRCPLLGTGQLGYTWAEVH